MKQIYNILEIVLTNLHNLRVITVKDFLGQQPTNIEITGNGDTINIFGTKVGEATENIFAADVQPKQSDIFSMVVFHEINHVVDTFTINKDKRHYDRKNKLIRNAGDISSNYLRRLDNSFFINKPQEFFAAISNDWISDSTKTIELGIACFEKGSKQPINQALFFMDMYSFGEKNSLFFTLDNKGLLTKFKVPITRDKNGYINSFVLNGKKYILSVDIDGNVIDCRSEEVNKNN